MLTSRSVLALIVTSCLTASAHGRANPLLEPPTAPFDAPAFDRLQPADFIDAVAEAVRREQLEVKAIDDDPAPPDFANTLAALDASGELLSRVKAVLSTLKPTVSTQALQEAAQKVAPVLAAESDQVLLDARLFARIKAVYDRRATLGLSAEQTYLLERTYRRFVRGGALLAEPQRERLREINRQLSLLELDFENNVVAETDASFVVLDAASDLAGLPDPVIAVAAEAARARGLAGKWVIGAQRASWLPFLTWSSRRDLREKVYATYRARCDRDNAHDNRAVWQRILVLRAERARLVGFETASAYFLGDRMAGSPAAVRSFLTSLWKPALARAEQDASELLDLARRDGVDALAPWDWRFYAERLRRAKYGVDDAAMRPYFEYERVRQGGADLLGALWGLTLVERRDVPVYHPDVRVYEVKESSGRTLALLYIDAFVRDGKQGGAWSGSVRDTRREKGRRVVPLVTLNANFARPAAGAPSLLSVEEVETFYHELGHALASMVADGTYVSNDVPLDAVELPSQLLENWVLEPRHVARYARHVRTGKPLPPELLQKLTKSRELDQGFDTVEYLASAFLDLDWHDLPSAADRNVDAFEETSMRALGAIAAIPPRHRTAWFAHLVGGYEAGYYAYIWAEVLAADAYAAFRETSPYDTKKAAALRKVVLEPFGRQESMGLYRQFRGREPSVDALLERRGLRRPAGP